MTDFEKYLKRIYLAKQKAEDDFIGGFDNIYPMFKDAVLDWIDDNLDMKGGLFVGDSSTVEKLNAFSEDIANTMSGIKQYKTALSEFIKNLKPISDEIIAFQKDVNKIDVKQSVVADGQKLIVDHIIDAYTENGMNVHFTQPLRDLIYRNITTGARVTDVKKAIGDFISSGKDKSGKFGRYIEQTAQQAVDSYSGMTSKKIMEKFDCDHLIMIGNLIETSSRQCKYAKEDLLGVISRDDFNKTLKAIAEGNGLIEGTSFDNLPFNKLHWGCRHEFVPILLKEGDTIGSNLIFENGKVKRK